MPVELFLEYTSQNIPNVTQIAGHLVGKGISIPPSVTKFAKPYDTAREASIVEISSLSEIKSFKEYPNEFTKRYRATN